MSHPSTDWMDDDACVGVDPEAFFSVDRDHGKANARAARKVCRTCPVTQQCQNYADAHNVQGIWAGIDRTKAVTR